MQGRVALSDRAYKAASVECRSRLMLLSVCRQLERIADHASNIAEDVVYLLSGDIIRHGENKTVGSPV